MQQVADIALQRGGHCVAGVYTHIVQGGGDEHVTILKCRRVNAERLATVRLKGVHVVYGIVVVRARDSTRVARVPIDNVQLCTLLRLPVKRAELCIAQDCALQPGRPNNQSIDTTST